MSEADDAVVKLYRTVVKWHLDSQPELAARLGKQDSADRWDDVSVAAFRARKEEIRQFLSEAETIILCDANCSEKIKTDLWLLKHGLQTYLDRTKFDNHLFLMSSFDGIQLDLYEIVKLIDFTSDSGYDTYIARLRTLPKRIEQTIETLTEGVKTGHTQHENSVMGVGEQLDSLIQEDLDTSPLMPPLPCAEGEQVKADELKKKIMNIWKVRVLPAIKKLQRFFEEVYCRKLRSKLGLSSLSGGGLWYAQCLKFHISCNMTPQKVHQLGLREVRQVRGRMVQLSKSLQLGEDPWQLYHAIHDDARNFLGTEDDVLDHVAELCIDQIRPKITKMFNALPEEVMKMATVAEEQADLVPGAYYQANVETGNGTEVGLLFINARELLARPAQDLTSLCLHEGEPGHHVQCVYASRVRGLRASRQTGKDSESYLTAASLCNHEAFVEGWALYAELLGEELDIYDKDSLFCRYVTEVHRAARLVVDTGIHALGWDYEEAMKFMEENTFAKEDWIRQELDKIITWPGRACSHKVGEVKIRNLRKKCETALGDSFSLANFHEFILENGPVPLAFLDHALPGFLARTKGGGQ